MQVCRKKYIMNDIKKIKNLKSEIVILKKSLMNLKFQKSTGQLEKTSEIKNIRIKIARSGETKYFHLGKRPAGVG